SCRRDTNGEPSVNWATIPDRYAFELGVCTTAEPLER
ncbi:unnamed protein product, partial [Rotaria socialis]